MKILQVNVNGQSGSTGKIVTDIKKVLEVNGHECIIAYGANDTIRNNGYVKILGEGERRLNAAISRLTGVKHGLFTTFSLSRLKCIIKKEKPDIVHVHCPNGYVVELFGLLEFLGSQKIKTVLTNHAEFYYTGGCGYAYDCVKWTSGCSGCDVVKGKIPFFDASKYTWNKFRKAFASFDKENLIITSVSPWTKSRAEVSPAQSGFRHEVVKNGVNTDIFHYTGRKKTELVELADGRKIILHVTASFSLRENDIKGGRYIAELAKLMPENLFVVAASFVHVTKDELPENVYVWGRTKDQQELAELYNTADCTVITSRRETFSMIVAESLCCGTPIVGFKAGGPESIAIPEYSQFAEYSNILALRSCVEKTINTVTLGETISKKAIEIYSKEEMTRAYLNIYFKLSN